MHFIALVNFLSKMHKSNTKISNKFLKLSSSGPGQSAISISNVKTQKWTIADAKIQMQ